MYNIVNRAKKQRLMLNSNTSIFPKRYYEKIFSEKLVNELHDWIENHPNIVHSHNVSDSLFVKINGTLVKKRKRLLQISV